MKQCEGGLGASGALGEQLRELRGDLGRYDVDISDSQVELLRRFCEKLLEWNRRINLISRKDEMHLVRRHVRESLALAIVLTPPDRARVMDLGSGAGLPGVPLKILRPGLRLFLVDSKRIRTLFLREIIENLKLNDAEVVLSRAESLIGRTDLTGVFDWVVARGVGSLAKLWEWSEPFLKRDGMLIALKGGELATEIRTLEVGKTKARTRSVPLPVPFVAPEKRRVAVVVKRGDGE